MNSFLAPVVEVVSLDDRQRDVLSFPAESTMVDARNLKNWLEQFYPPAMMTRSGYVTKLTGSLTLQPAGLHNTNRQAVLQGDINLVMDDALSTHYVGRLAAVLTYANDSSEPISMKGVMRGIFPKRDLRAGRTRLISLSAAFHSLPE